MPEKKKNGGNEWTGPPIYGKGRHHGDSTAMDDEERRECDGDVGAAGGGSDKGQRGIKTLIKLNSLLYILSFTAGVMASCCRSDGATRAGGGRRDESGRSEEWVAVTMAAVGGQRDKST